MLKYLVFECYAWWITQKYKCLRTKNDKNFTYEIQEVWLNVAEENHLKVLEILLNFSK